MRGKPEVRIENWAVVGTDLPYMAPEIRPRVLQGRVFGHPTIEDGSPATTSGIVAFDLENRRVETQNTVYLLGAIRPEYFAAAMRSAAKRETKAALLKHWGAAA